MATDDPNNDAGRGDAAGVRADSSASDRVPASAGTPHEADASTARAAASAPLRRRLLRRAAWWLGGTATALLVLAVVAIGALLWALRDPAGTAWLLARTPQLKVTAPRGSLLGDFAAERIEITLPGSGVLRLDAPRWQALTASHGERGRWLHLRIATLHADRAVWLPAEPTADATPSTPSSPPQSLRLPVEIEVGTASIDELRIGGDDARPIRAVRARLHLGAEGGSVHRADDIEARIERAAARGRLGVGADPPFGVDADVEANGIDAPLPWTAHGRASGPLAALQVAVAASVPGAVAPSSGAGASAGAASRAASPGAVASAGAARRAGSQGRNASTEAASEAQSLDARAVVRPFAAWPLGELNASFAAFDLSTFASAAPKTSLSGQATIETSALDAPASVSVSLVNARAGLWNDGFLPVTTLRAELRARPDDPRTLDVRSLDAELGSNGRAGLASGGANGAGRLSARGRWSPERWNVDVDLRNVRPHGLDVRAPETSLDGTASVVGSGFASERSNDWAIELNAKLAGLLAESSVPRSAPRQARLRVEARVSAKAIDVRVAEASLGDATATSSGRVERRGDGDRAPWHAAGRVELERFDPLPWWPGAGNVLARGPNRLDAAGEFDLTLPLALTAPERRTASAAEAGRATPERVAVAESTRRAATTANAAAGRSEAPTVMSIVAATRGRARVTIADSVLAGVALSGQASFVNDDGSARATLQFAAAGNRLDAEGRIAADASARDDWQLAIDAPRLGALAPLAAGRPLAGALTATARVQGRWPELTSEGRLHAASLRIGALAIREADGLWRAGSSENAALEATLAMKGVDVGGRAIEAVDARIDGTSRAHRAALRIVSAALPPAWVDTLAVAMTPGPATAAAATAASSPSSRSVVVASVEGGLVDANREQAAGWRGTLREIAVRALAPPARTWLVARDVSGSVYWGGGALRASVEPGSAQALGATLRWSRIAWQAGDAATPARLEAHATIDAFAVAPALRALQPEFGWGGDLVVAARLDVQSAPAMTVDAAIERRGGDLTVTDELGTQALGIGELRVGATAEGGVWRLAAGVAGRDLGVASAAVTARTSSRALWPEPTAPIDGVAELRIANVGNWGTWVPAGWRVAGELHASGRIGGRFGAPEYTGRIEGSGLAVRNFLQGVNVTDGEVAIALQGATARIERFSARGGEGTVSLEGAASFDESPDARLTLIASRFQMLGRVDRRIVASGRAAVRLDAKALVVDGRFRVDEGLIDFSRSDAPTLGDDVEVVRRPVAAPTATTSTAATTATSTASETTTAPEASPAVVPATRNVALDIDVDLGENLRVRGRGLDAGLVGELHIASPGNRLVVQGAVRTVRGTYQAYGRKLRIDRGVLTFVGPVENPRLDIEATRPDIDVRVGVAVSGTALAPRVRLFADSDMSDLDKLSWLVLGRASETTGGADTALLQGAALALLSGEGPGVTDRLIKSIGLDEVSVRQQSQGTVRDTIVSLGKQISKRWYVGYERGLNSTTGTWQLIYRIAQRVTVRAEAGGDNAIDVNWTLRWK